MIERLQQAQGAASTALASARPTGSTGACHVAFDVAFVLTLSPALGLTATVAALEPSAVAVALAVLLALFHVAWLATFPR